MTFVRKDAARHRQRAAAHAAMHMRHEPRMAAGMPHDPVSAVPDAAPVAEQAPAVEPGPDSKPLFTEPVMDRDELARRFPDYKTRRSGWSRILERTATIAGLFAIAGAAGALGAAWIGAHGDVQAMLYMIAPERILNRPSAAHAEAPVSTATSPGELPFDGLTPEKGGNPSANAAPAPDAAPTPGAAPVPDAGPVPDAAPAPAAEESSGANAVQPDNAPAPELAVPAAANSQLSEPGNVPRQESTAHAKISPAAEKASEPAPRKVKKVRPPQRKIARGKEISRIQHQATEELKKKTEKRRLVRVKQEKAARAGRTQVAFDQRADAESRREQTYAALARCNRISHLIRREQCKWQACNGKWGRDGCP